MNEIQSKFDVESSKTIKLISVTRDKSAEYAFLFPDGKKISIDLKKTSWKTFK